MKFLQCQQGTQEWLDARAGLVTASEFSTAVSTVGGLDDRQLAYVYAIQSGMSISAAAAHAGYKAPPTSDSVRRVLNGEQIERPSDTAQRYAADLTFERISGKPYGEPPKTWVLARGHELEFGARMVYEARTRSFVTEAGLCVSDEGIFGYSTDGLVNDDGLIEIKAPIDSVKIMTMWRTGDTSEYDHQMQGGMGITGRKWCDFIMYAPALASVGKDLYIKRIYREEAFIEDLFKRLGCFNDLVEANVALLRGSIADESVPAPKAQPVVADWKNEFLSQ